MACFALVSIFTVTHNTATGIINIITQQANQRLELIARIFAETGMSDLFKFLIKLNQMFIDEETVIRLTNGPMTIAPDDLTGEFDLIVNAGMGSGAKQVNLQNLRCCRASSRNWHRSVWPGRSSSTIAQNAQSRKSAIKMWMISW